MECLVYSLLIISIHGVFGIHDSSILNLYKHTFHGDGTYYGKGESGTCSLNIPHMPPVARHVDKFIALNSPQFYGSSACGMCFQINGTGQGHGNDPITGSFIAYVKDLCPECHAGSVDLAVNGDGRWKVSIQAVQCPVGNTKIEYRFEGSNDYYIKLQVRNDRMPTTSIEMFQPKSHKWIPLTRTTDGFWIFGIAQGVEKPIKSPIKVRLHSPNGQALLDTIHVTSMSSTNVMHGNGVQFHIDHTLRHAYTESGTGLQYNAITYIVIILFLGI